MELSNRTTVTEFLLQGSSEIWELQLFLCILLLPFYLIILPGNILIIVTIISDSHLGSPMFFFLANLALMDICYSCIMPPKIVVNFISSSRTISSRGCMAQIFFIHFLGAAEMILLITVSFDSYIAICSPLRYATVMTRELCWVFVLGSWAGGFIHTMIQVMLINPLPFCGPNELENFFCDITQIVKLVCTNTDTLEFIMFVN
ncbi:olfactory receptor 4M1-like [Liasis olivaceus]